MLKDGKVVGVLAVSDMEQAKDFYGGTLGLEIDSENPGGVTYECEDGEIFVYESEFAGTNKATAALWKVDDLDATVAELKAKGVSFERYDLAGATWEGDIASWGPMRSAWFVDPFGNIIAVGTDS